MTISINGQHCYSPQDLYKLSQAGPLLLESQQVKETRYSSLADIPNPDQKKIGTVDATSCLGLLYTTSQGDRIVQHFDNRDGEKFLKIFNSNAFSGPMHVTIIGGCRLPNPQGEFAAEYQLLETHTKENIESIMKAWINQSKSIVVDNWIIGDAKDNASLCSDFVAGPNGRKYLLKPGVALQQGAVPELPRRMVAQWLNNNSYTSVFDSVALPNTLQIPNVSAKWNLQNLASVVNQYVDDSKLLMNLSTTPTLEPPHFAKMMRDSAAFINSNVNTSQVMVPIDATIPVIVLQGEFGRLR